MSQDLVAINVRETSSTKQHKLGTRYVQPETGKIYRYTKAGAVALAVAELCVNPDVDNNVVNKTVAATYAVGATQVLVNVAGTVVQDAYADGSFTVSDATGEGVEYRVVGNTGVTGSGTITVSLASPLTLALTVSVSEYTLTKSPWDSVVVSITDQADMAVGVPNVAIAIGEYGWLQTRGICSVLWDEAVTKGQALTTGTGTAGAVEAQDAAGEPQIGVASQAGVDTEHQSAFLTID
jgi:hypothetical protein